MGLKHGTQEEPQVVSLCPVYMSQEEYFIHTNVDLQSGMTQGTASELDPSHD